jgi:hypothetical protein
MIEDRILFEIGKKILVEDLRKSGPTVAKPHYRATGHGMDLEAGNLFLHLYDEESQDMYLRDKTRSRYFGIGTGHYICGGSKHFSGAFVLWYLAANN